MSKKREEVYIWCGPAGIVPGLGYVSPGVQVNAMHVRAMQLLQQGYVTRQRVTQMQDNDVQRFTDTSSPLLPNTHAIAE